ncbi:MAG TPA: VOC family protein [Sphingomicrobium sp.]|nr:VOC family protein [Sphingomicrobium sp.]
MNAFLLAVAAITGFEPQPIASVQGAFFALSVADADASAKWYSEKLGLSVILRPPAQNGTRMIAVGGGGLMVELIERKGAAPLKQIAPQIGHDTLVHGIFKAGVVVEDWEGLISVLKARGVPMAIGPFPRSAEQRANLMIRDNEGNYIQFFEKRPAPAEAAAED